MAKILLNNGTIIYSDKVAVFYVRAGTYLVFPTPVKRNDDLQVLTSIPNGELFVIRDMLGRIIFKKEVQSARQNISTGTLVSGIYFYQIVQNNAVLKTGRLIIL